MPPNNPYIEKVRLDPDILTDTKEIYSHRGKWSEYFGNNSPLVLEIGTGMGNFFGKQVTENPDKNFLGIEIRYKRLFQTAQKSRKTNKKPSFVILKDFGQNISRMFETGEISETYIFFPDPRANKDRQRKHRLLQEKFLSDLHDITSPGGKVYFKTDHKEYFDSTKEIIESQGLWKISRWTHNYEASEFFDMKNITEFEGFYRGENTDICYLELEK